MTLGQMWRGRGGDGTEDLWGTEDLAGTLVLLPAVLSSDPGLFQSLEVSLTGKGLSGRKVLTDS